MHPKPDQESISKQSLPHFIYVDVTGFLGLTFDHVMSVRKLFGLLTIYIY